MKADVFSRQKNHVRRVELHGHTWYSGLKGMPSPKELLETARTLGISGLAVTDYGCVAAMPELQHNQTDAADFILAAGMDAMTESFAEEFCSPELKPAWELGKYMFTMIAVNDTGRRNLYFNSSMGSVFGRENVFVESDSGRENAFVESDSDREIKTDPPVFSSFLIGQTREGILLGSSGEKGELFSLLAENYQKDRKRDKHSIDREIRHLVNYLDFLELFPYTPTCGLDKQTVIQIHKDIVQLGEKYGKPVAASAAPMCESRNDTERSFKPKEVLVRPFLNTAEMLEEFAYLGMEKAYEVVVEQPVKLMSVLEPYLMISAEKKYPEICSEYHGEELADRLNQNYWASIPSRTKGHYHLNKTPFLWNEQEHILSFSWKQEKEKELCMRMLSELEEGLQIFPAADNDNAQEFVQGMDADEVNYCLIPADVECAEEIPFCVDPSDPEMKSMLQFPLEVLKNRFMIVRVLKDVT